MIKSQGMSKISFLISRHLYIFYYVLFLNQLSLLCYYYSFFHIHIPHFLISSFYIFFFLVHLFSLINLSLSYDQQFTTSNYSKHKFFNIFYLIVNLSSKLFVNQSVVWIILIITILMTTIQLKIKEIQLTEIKPSLNLQDKPKIPQTINLETKPTKISQLQDHSATIIQPDTRVKSFCRKIVIGLIISLSALMFGYSLKEITSVPIATLIKQYEITINKFTAQSILIGILPLGAIIGVVITKFLITRYKRLTGIYIFTFVNVGAIVLVNITTFQTLIVGRLIQGICIGYYTTIAPIYLKEIAPKEIRKMLGLFFSLGKIIGVLIVIMIELILDAYPNSIDFRIILSMTAVFSILQAILIFFFGSDTPAQMIEKGNQKEAMKIIQQFYKASYVKQVFEEYKKQYEMEMSKGKDTLSQNLNIQSKKKKNQFHFQMDVTDNDLKNQIQSQPNVANFIRFSRKAVAKRQDTQENLQQKKLTFQDKKDYAYCLGLHLCAIRHWTGGNAIITQGGLFITTLNPSLGHYTSLIINAVQFIFVLIGLIFIQKLVGKRPLFLFSVILMSFINLGLAIAMMNSQILTSLFLMCLFMVIYGGSFISPIWSYPSEIIPASQALLPNIIHWLALAISTLIPPIITGIMPNNNPYPVFLFFGLYGLFSFIHIFRFLKESDGKSYNQIIKSFK